MVSNDNTPTYNLKVVVRETGLKPDTLRAWERRYKLPQPQRTAGGHRLYSQRDIDTLKWLVARQQDGLSISRAVDLWNQLKAENQDPLQSLAETTPVAPLISTTDARAINELREAWISACLDFDERQSEYLLTQAFALYPQEVVCIELLMQGLAKIGEDWYKGDITVQQEHFASALAIRRLETLLAAAPTPTRPERILIGCPPKEDHTFSPLLLSLLLRRQGWDVVYLGANVPLDRFETSITSTKSNLVILSAQQLLTAATLLDMARMLNEQDIPLTYGGRIFNMLPDVQQRIPGYFLAERLDQVPMVVEQLFTSAPAPVEIEVAPEHYLQALDSFRDHRPKIEADVWQALESKTAVTSHLSLINGNMGQYIIAGLKLGNLDYIGIDLEWLKGLLTNYNVSSEYLYQYLETYYNIADQHLNGHGKPILDWLRHLLSEYDDRENIS